MFTVERHVRGKWVCDDCETLIQASVPAQVDALRDVVLGQQVIHADETPVQLLMPGTKKIYRSYVGAYTTTQFCETAAVFYDFSPSRAGEHAHNFLQGRKAVVLEVKTGSSQARFAAENGRQRS